MMWAASQLFNPGANPIARSSVPGKFILSTLRVGQVSEAFHETASYRIEKVVQSPQGTAGDKSKAVDKSHRGKISQLGNSTVRPQSRNGLFDRTGVSVSKCLAAKNP